MTSSPPTKATGQPGLLAEGRKEEEGRTGGPTGAAESGGAPGRTALGPGAGCRDISDSASSGDDRDRDQKDK